jgi:ATP-binding cassette subfamily B protein
MTPAGNRRAIRFLLSHLKRHRNSLSLGFIVLVGVDTLQLVIPRIIQNILDGLGSADPAKVIRQSLLIVIMAILMLILRFFWRLFIVKPSRRIEERMRTDLFGHLEKLSAPFFNRTKTGDLMALFVNDIGAIRMALGMGLVGLFDAVFMSTLSLAFMAAIDPLLTLIIVAPMPLIIFIFIRMGRLMQARHTAVQESFGVISTHTQESFSGIRVIKGFGREEHELARFREHCDDYAEKNLSLTKLWGIIFPTITLLTSVSFCLLMFFGGQQVLHTTLTLGQFVAFMFYINLLIWPVVAIGWVWSMMQRAIASSKRLLEILESAPDVRVITSDTPLPPIAGEIECKNLSFTYASDKADALHDITIDIPANSSLGIIGKPGSGKTTLASLLFHLYPIPESRLFIDKTDINRMPLGQLRHAIAYVPQDSFLFSDTIRANIAFAQEDNTVSPDRIEEAARIAGVHDEICRFADRYETRIGERGITLSGGQKQRIAIARALLADHARILVLDDALSSVDSSTEALILRNMQNAIRRRTSIIIAHRISTIRQCDRIIVLDNGRIVESGTHDELSNGVGLYARLARLQSERHA